jgi:hypothetical protein
MRDELAVETIENSFKIGLNHPMIQQRPKINPVLREVTQGVIWRVWGNALIEFFVQSSLF